MMLQWKPPLFFFNQTLCCFSLQVLNLSKTLGKVGGNITLHSNLRICRRLGLQPLQVLRMTFCVWRVFSGLDLKTGVCCCSCHSDYLCRKCFWVLWTENNRLKVSCKVCAFGLWITISEPISDGYMVIQEVISGISKMCGAICSLQRSAPLQKQPKHIPACLYPTLIRVLSFYRLSWPIHQPKYTLPKGGKL